MTSAGGAEREARERAAENMDWDQVAMNGGPPCFQLQEHGFCGRAKRWPGHHNGVAKANRDGCAHEFVSLATLLARCANEARLEALEQAAAKVETMKFAHGDSWHCFMAPSHEAEELAAAIRALKGGQHEN